MTHVWRGPGAQVAVSQGVEFVADATQRELAKISLGLSASGSLSGSTFEGTVRARSRDLDPATGLGVVRITLTKVHSVPVRTYGRGVITTAIMAKRSSARSTLDGAMQTASKSPAGSEPRTL